MPAGAALSIDFDMRFGMVTMLGDEKVVFNDVKFLGFVDQLDRLGTPSLGSDRSKKIGTGARGWLVIEKSNGQRVFIPANSIVYFWEQVPDEPRDVPEDEDLKP